MKTTKLYALLAVLISCLGCSSSGFAQETNVLRRIRHAAGKVASVFLTQKGLNDRLLDAVKQGSLADVESYIDYGASANAVDDKGDSAMLLVVRHGNIEIVKYLAEHGAYIQCPETMPACRMPLVEAAALGHLDIMKYFIEEKKADVNADAVGGESSLMSAIEHHKKPMVEYLVAHGANVNGTSGRWNETPLMKAAATEQLDMVQYLVGKGADVNGHDSTGETALMKAAQAGRIYDYADSLKIVEYLVGKGAQVNAVTKWDETALSRAAGRGQLGKVKYLVEKGATDLRGALHVATGTRYGDVIEYLNDKIFKNK